jgi:hypothetical protein
MTRFAPALLILLAVAGPAAAGDIVATVADRDGLALTIYQDEVAVVRDRRWLTLDKGASALVMEGVARAARPGTATLKGAGLTVAESGLDLDTLTAESLLAAQVGHEATVVWRDPGGAERSERAKILAASGVPVFEIDGKVVAGQPERILYDGLPPNLRPTPAFRAALSAEAGGRHLVELAYMTGGLTWTAENNAELEGDHLALSVSANITNSSGTDFTDASVRLVAGSINQAPAPSFAQARPLRAMAVGSALPDAAPHEPAGPYHVFTVGRKLSLRDGDHRQVPLMAAASVPVERELVLDPLPPRAFRDRSIEANSQHPALVLKFINDSHHGLGKPLPAGVVRVAERGSDGQITFLGEDLLPAIPEGAAARITVGRAFDVTARRVQTDFQRVSAEVTEAAWEVRLANAGAHPATVVVRESFSGDWLVIDESRTHAKENAVTARWSLPLAAKGEAVLRYRVRVKG